MSNEEFQALREREALERANRPQEQPLPAADEPPPELEPATTQQFLPLKQLESPEVIDAEPAPLEAADSAPAPRP